MFDNERLHKQLEFLIEIDKVKQVFRNTILLDASRRENDAEHTWHMAVCALMFQEYSNQKEIDMLKVLKIILLHDIVEIYAGDTFAYDEKGNVGRLEREQDAAEKIFGLLPEDQKLEFRELWDEFEESKTPESKYAHLIDTFMPIFHNYCTKGLQWQKFNVTRERVLNRNRQYIENGSKFLWEYVESIIKEAVEKGYLGS